MTQTARQYFVDKGYLTKSPHPSHKFDIGRLIGEWQMAKDSWVHLDDSGKIHHHIFTVEIQETTDNLRLLNIVIWRLKIVMGLLPK